MHDFHDDAEHHHGSLCKQITAFKRQALSLAWAFLGTFGNSWTLCGILDILALALVKFYSFGLWAKFTYKTE